MEKREATRRSATRRASPHTHCATRPPHFPYQLVHTPHDVRQSSRRSPLLTSRSLPPSSLLPQHHSQDRAGHTGRAQHTHRHVDHPPPPRHGRRERLWRRPHEHQRWSCRRRSSDQARGVFLLLLLFRLHDWTLRFDGRQDRGSQSLGCAVVLVLVLVLDAAGGAGGGPGADQARIGEQGVSWQGGREGGREGLSST